MKVNITSKGFTANERQIALIEKKFGKLSKFFSDDTVANVTMGYKKNRQTMEAMIPVKGMIFRSEYTDNDMNVCLDKVVNRLTTQITRYKKKIEKSHRHVVLHRAGKPHRLVPRHRHLRHERIHTGCGFPAAKFHYSAGEVCLEFRRQNGC